MRVLILDDELAACEDLRNLLGQHLDVEVVGEATDVATALEITRKQQPDVVFLDVCLRGETAFDYVGQLGNEKPRLVFVTAYDSYAVRGFECNALDYLLKPVLETRLGEALDRVRSGSLPERKAPGPEDSVFLPIDGSAQLVPWSEIDWIQSEGNYSRVHLRDDRTSTVLRSMKQWKELSPSEMFIPVSRSVLIRLHAVAAISPSEQTGRKVVLDRGAEFQISRRHWPLLRESLIAWHPEVSRILP